MQKFLRTLVSGILLTTTLNADIMRVEVGMGAWTHTPTGEITKASIKSGDTTSEAYIWALLKHPIPLIPNLKIEYSNAVANSIATSTTFKQYDIVPYYNLLDNTLWLTLDVGIDLKFIDASMDTSPLLPISSNIITDSTVLPLAYLRSRIQIPFTGLGGEADIKYLSYDNTVIYDAKIKVDYTFTSFPVIEPGIELGYRVQKIETSDLLGINMALDFKGVYAGVMLRF